MSFRSIRFGTDGWRAIIAREFTVENVLRVASGIASHLSKKEGPKHVVIGYDTRFGGKLFSESLAIGLIRHGIHVMMDHHYVTTPMVSYAAKALHCDLGIMFTASHNPPDYQGLKVKDSAGGPASDELVAEIVKGISDSAEYPSNEDYKTLRDHSLFGQVDLESVYTEHLLKHYNLDALRKDQSDFIFDAMNGSAQGYFKRLFPDMDAIRMNDDPTFKGVSPEPIEKNLGPLSIALKKGNYKLGLAVDGDADRIGLMDSSGSIISSHHVMLLMIHYLIHYKHLSGKVVTGFSSSQKIKALCKHYGLDLEIVKIGFKHASKIMRNEDVLLAGEEAGGISIKGHIPERDGIWNVMLFIEMLQNTGKSIEELLQEVEDLVGAFEYLRDDLLLDEKVMQEAVQKLKTERFKEIGGKAVESIEDLDGIKYYFNADEWLMFRASGTEPLLRIYAESSSREKCRALIDAGKEVLGI